jgi:hypothetical protein
MMFTLARESERAIHKFTVLNKRALILMIFILSGGIASVIGVILIQEASSLVEQWIFKSSPEPSSLFFNVGNIILPFVSGLLTAMLVLPRLVKKLVRSPEKTFPKTGLFYGATGGIVNTAILAALATVGIIFSPSLAGAGFWGAIISIARLLLYTIPVSELIFGIPAAIIGALWGVLAEALLRRTSLLNSARGSGLLS